MLTMQLAALVLSVCGTAADPDSFPAVTVDNIVLLDFQADWCGPCRSMEGTVGQLIAAGYPVQKINIDQHKDLARRFQIQAIPCFVLVSNGHEVDRIVGPATTGELQSLFARARTHGSAAAGAPPAAEYAAPAGAATVAANSPPQDLFQVRAQSPDPAPQQFSAPQQAPPPQAFSASGSSPRPRNKAFGPSAMSAAASAAAPAAAQRVSLPQLLAASVRLTVEDATGFSYGSGTLVDVRQGSALIVTCGHIFRDSHGKGKITVDVFGSNPQSKLAGQLVSYDLKRDVALVSISPAGPVATIPVAPAGYRVSTGDPVVSVGCDNGANPSVRESKVTSLDKFLGPANIEVAGQPVQGRSGGGLFSSSGLLIGVCNAADPADNEGLYAAASVIHAQLDQSGLASVYQRGAGAVAASAVATAAPASAGPSMPARMPATDLSGVAAAGTRSLARAADTLRQLSPQERATLSELRQKAQGAEVICIVRSVNDPHAKSQIIVLDRASAAFLDLLAAERETQASRHLTSLEVPRQPSTLPTAAALKKPVSTAGGNPWQPNWRSDR